MANCCSGSTCQELVTLGYMREMVNRTEVRGCFVVNGDYDFSSCCYADESAYTPTYGDITSGAYADSRLIDDLDPSKDVNGFSVSTMPSSFISCCSGDSNSANIVKSDLVFGYTKPIGNSISVTEISVCNPTFNYTEEKTWERWVLSGCNGYITSASSVVSTLTTSSDELSASKNFSAISQTITDSNVKCGYRVSFDTSRIDSSTSAACFSSVTSSSLVTLEGYDVTFSLDWGEQLSCTDGKIKIDYFLPNYCDNLYLYVSGSSSNFPNGRYDVLGISGQSQEWPLPVSGKNTTNESLMVKVTASTDNSFSSNVYTYEIPWAQCSWTPTLSKKSCGVLLAKYNWENGDDQTQLDCGLISN